MKIAIDDISMAMEDHTGAVEHFLNRQTGDLLRVPIVPDDADEHEDALAALEKSPADWVQIPSLPSPDAFQIMEDFVAGLPEGDPRKTLKLVLGFKKPFANFKRAARHAGDSRAVVCVSRRAHGGYCAPLAGI